MPVPDRALIIEGDPEVADEAATNLRDLGLLATGSTEPGWMPGMETCADQCLPWPFGGRELAARVKALLRRAHAEQDAAAVGSSPGRIVIGDLKTVRGVGYRFTDLSELTA
jgi:DNA-binding response OmpR family regulator